jgi:hypothetical protein
MNEEKEYGERRSIKYKEGKMLFIWGHDEAIFKQFLLTKKTGWASMERLLSSQKMMELGC